MSLGERLWSAVRHDIGRKLTALALALGVWFLLERQVLDDGGGLLEVRVVASLDEANAHRASTGLPAVYLVVPPSLIVLEHQPTRVRLQVKGLRDDVQALDMSAFIELGEKDLGGEDERLVIRTLGREDFRSRGEPPELTLFRLDRDPTVDIKVALARRATATVSLGPANAVVTGAPARGYAFDSSRIQVQPNAVELTGPRAVVDALLADPAALRLAPVDVTGRTTGVSQQVTLGAEALARKLSLSTASGRVAVIVPVDALPVDRPLVLIPVNYLNQAHLQTQGFRLSGRGPEAVDVVVRGPQSELARYSNEELAERISLQLDYSRITLAGGQNRAEVECFTRELSDAVKVLAVDGLSAPKVQFTLQEVERGP